MSPEHSTSCARIVGLVLAGGQASRMQGQDKALIKLAGQPLLVHVLARLRPQVDMLALNSNAPPQTHSLFNLPTLPDVIKGFQGPLAGIHAGMLAFPRDCLLTVAVDLPFLPADLVARLQPVLRVGGCAFASREGAHALAVLWAPGLANTVEAALLQGRGSLRALLAEIGTPVAIPDGPDSDLSCNVNTPEELMQAEHRIQNQRDPNL